MRSIKIGLAVALLAPQLAHAGQMAGVSAAVRGNVLLSRETVVGQRVQSGEDIYLGDAIESGPKSGMQVLLLDETVFTIGPDSKLTIDKFVYDPATGTGELSAEVAKGVFRFVSGKVAENNPNAMKVRVPSGNLGIRGTIVGGEVQPEGNAIVFLLGEGPNNDLGAKASSFDVENAGVSVQVSRPGWGAELAPNTPPILFRVPETVIQAATAQLNDPGDGTEAGEPRAEAEPGATKDGDSPEGEDKAGAKKVAGKPAGPKPAGDQQDAKPGKPQGGKAPGPKPLLMGGAPGPPPLAPPGAPPLGPNGIPTLPPLPPLPTDPPVEMIDLAAVPTFISDLTSDMLMGQAHVVGQGILNHNGSFDGDYDFQIVADFDADELYTDFYNIRSYVFDIGTSGGFPAEQTSEAGGHIPFGNPSGAPAEYSFPGNLISCAGGTCFVNIEVKFSGGASASFISHDLKLDNGTDVSQTAPGSPQNVARVPGTGPGPPPTKPPLP